MSGGTTTLGAMHDLADLHDPLPHEDQTRLAAAAQAGDRDAREVLVTTNMRLILNIVRRSTALRRGCDFEDLAQEGAMGFLRGVELFDPTRGLTLATFAAFHAEAYVRRYADNTIGAARVPVKAHAISRQAYKARQRLGQGASDETIAADVGVSVERLRQCERAVSNAYGLSLDLELGGEEGLTLGGVIADPRAEADVRRAEAVATTAKLVRFADLTDRQADIIRRVCVDEQSCHEIARDYGVAHQGVSESHHRALDKLRAVAEELEGAA